MQYVLSRFAPPPGVSALSPGSQKNNADHIALTGRRRPILEGGKKEEEEEGKEKNTTQLLCRRFVVEVLFSHSEMDCLHVS